jgi:hypothetical protein
LGWGSTLRHDLEQIADEPDIGDLEDRCLRILVDRNDRAGILDAGEMLDGARNADGHVELRRDDLAGLPHLQLVRHVARIHGGARSAHGRAELVGEAVDELEVLGAAQRPPTRDDARAALQVGPVALGGGLEADEARMRSAAAASGGQAGFDGVAAATLAPPRTRPCGSWPPP